MTETKALKTIYVAHALGKFATREPNRQRASEWVAFLALNFAVAPVADWIIISGEWDETDALRERGLAIDFELIARADELWAVGEGWSPGMKLEAERARAIGTPVIDLTGLPMSVPMLMARGARS